MISQSWVKHDRSANRILEVFELPGVKNSNRGSTGSKGNCYLARKGYWYAVVDDVLYYERVDVPNRCRVAIPKHLREQIITDHHDTVYTGAVQKMTHWYY